MSIDVSGYVSDYCSESVVHSVTMGKKVESSIPCEDPADSRAQGANSSSV